MSIWADIQDRSVGTQEKREDIFNQIQDEIPQPITYAGVIDDKLAKLLNSNSQGFIPTGSLYSVNGACKIGGQDFYCGDMILYDGSKWHLISREYKLCQ